MWKETGWGTIMYLASLSGINPELYEAAMIDGCGRMKMIRHITLPGIINTVVVVFVMRMGVVLKNGFEQIFLLQNSLVLDVSEVFETYTYRLGLIDGAYDIASAVGLLQSVVGFILVITSNSLARRFNEGGGVW